MSDDTSACDPATPLPATQCPLCGRPNACAPACSGSFDTPCWCRDAVFTEALLARVPAASRGLACVCAACVAEALAAGSTPAPLRPSR